MDFAWTCACCGKQHNELPTCWSCGPPASYLAVPKDERAERTDLNDDICVVDNHCFIRGGIEIPILDTSEVLQFVVWASLSDKSMSIIEDTWYDPDRARHGPFFGWLNSHLIPFGETISLPMEVHNREPGMIPLIVPHPSDHPLSVAQQTGVTTVRVVEIAGQLLPRH